MMREVFAHEAVLRLAPDGDSRAPGAVVTVALCGQWEHEPPCVTPHHTAATELGDELVVRTLFATEPASEGDVRSRIAEALASGELAREEGLTHWQLRSSTASELTEAEREHAQRLIRSVEG